MRLSASGRAFIKREEGLSLTAYRDADGYSIGYGHYGAKPGDVITQAEADRLFDEDAVKYESAVSRLVSGGAPTSQAQFDAMTSLTYNIGIGKAETAASPGSGFTGSTVLKKHRAGDYGGAADAFLMWVKSQGKVLAVLQQRRARERAAYLEGRELAPAPLVPGGGSFGGAGASGSWGTAPTASAPPIHTRAIVDPATGRISFAAPGNTGLGAGALIAGIGALFFCPNCGGASDSVEVRPCKVKI